MDAAIPPRIAFIPARAMRMLLCTATGSATAVHGPRQPSLLPQQWRLFVRGLLALETHLSQEPVPFPRARAIQIFIIATTPYVVVV